MVHGRVDERWWCRPRCEEEREMEVGGGFGIGGGYNKEEKEMGIARRCKGMGRVEGEARAWVAGACVRCRGGQRGAGRHVRKMR